MEGSEQVPTLQVRPWETESGKEMLAFPDLHLFYFLPSDLSFQERGKNRLRVVLELGSETPTKGSFCFATVARAGAVTLPAEEKSMFTFTFGL